MYLSPQTGRRESYLNVAIYVEGSAGSWTPNSETRFSYAASTNIRVNKLSSEPSMGCVEKRADSRNYAPARGRLSTGCYPTNKGILADHDAKSFPP